MNTQQSIIENNKLIAEFMGLQITADQKAYFIELGDSKYFNTNKGITQNAMLINRLRYNSSWDWLMTIVENIESLNHWVEIYGVGCYVKPKTTEGYLKAFNASTKIECVYNACIDFIKWFNTQLNSKNA